MDLFQTHLVMIKNCLYYYFISCQVNRIPSWISESPVERVDCISTTAGFISDTTMIKNCMHYYSISCQVNRIPSWIPVCSVEIVDCNSTTVDCISTKVEFNASKPMSS